MVTEPGAAAPVSAFPFASNVRRVGNEEPFAWLAAGWRDLRRGGRVSLAYGLIFVGTGFALTAGLGFTGHAYLIGPLVGGFLLVGPALTVGLYQISRDLAAGRRPSLISALTAWRQNPVPLLGLGLLLVAFLIVWLRIAVVQFAVFFPYDRMNLKAMVNTVFFTIDGWAYLAVGTAIGAVFSTVAFAVGAFSLPMLLDRRAHLLEAIGSSVAAVVLNIRAMVLWAALIVIFTLAGIVTLFAGLAVILPLIGHATWHAYRATILPREVPADDDAAASFVEEP
ncbi:MAG: DUF2189 domain-containing protein [Rhodospirillales bacterium]|jgi:uncharacterized membrane protein|nr:DUF2189 domain-containing protein [Rhodospirillales bacterium]